MSNKHKSKKQKSSAAVVSSSDESLDNESSMEEQVQMNDTSAGWLDDDDEIDSIWEEALIITEKQLPTYEEEPSMYSPYSDDIDTERRKRRRHREAGLGGLGLMKLDDGNNCITEEDEAMMYSSLNGGRLRLPDVEPIQIPAPVESPATVKRHMEYAIEARASYYGDL